MTRPSIRTTAAATGLAMTLSGCLGAGYDPATGLYARTLGGAPATPNPTPYTQPLECLRITSRARAQTGPALAVGAIADLTGRSDLETGRKISQGASLFAITALGKAGLPVVERYDRAVSDVELAYAQSGALSDGGTEAGPSPALTQAAAPGIAPVELDPEVLPVGSADPGPTASLPQRTVSAGQIAGSRYYIVGGVTELNYNLRSSGIDAVGGETDDQGLKGNFRNQSYVMNVAIDLRLVDSVSQQVAAVASYQKQMIGREIRAGVFDFLDGNVFDISGGASQLEPLQLGVRTLVERGVFDMAAHLYGIDRSACLPAGLDGEDGVTPLLPLGPQALVIADIRASGRVDRPPRRVGAGREIDARILDPIGPAQAEDGSPIEVAPPPQGPLYVPLRPGQPQGRPGSTIDPNSWRLRRD